MVFKYNWKNNEANFGPPIEKQVEGGMHITVEIIIKKGNKYIAVRRQSIPGHEPPPKAKNHPQGLLYFCHDLIRYGESIEESVKRIVEKQMGVSVKDFRVVDIDSFVQEKDGQWAFTPYVIAEVKEIPKPGKYGNEITEVVEFYKNNVPNDFAWWTQKELKEFLE